MKSRTRLIITALLACHLFLHPQLLTSQLHAAAPDQASAQTDARTGSSQADAGPVNGAENTTAGGAAVAGKAPPNATSQPEFTVETDTGQEDKKTEQIIQQELQTSTATQELGPPRPAANVALGQNEVLIRGDEQEKNRDIYKARGHVEVRFRTYVLHADQVTYDSTTGKITATGHVVFDGGPHNEHVVATHATYDVSRDSGTFFDATGSTGIRVKNTTMFLTSSTPFFFSGKVVDKLGPDLYRVNHGYVTSCQLPKPKWEFNAKTANVELGDEAKMYHATIRIHGIPLFYFPFVEHPADQWGRKSGFLIPDIGQSNTRGTIIGDGFYWAINRSSDATIGGWLYSARGWAQHAQYRTIGREYQFHTEYFGVVDEKGQPGTGQNQGGEEIKANGFINLPSDFRGILSLDFLSSYIFRLAFGQSFTEAINSEVRSTGFLYKNWHGYSLDFDVARYQDYQSTTPNDDVVIQHLPTLEFSSVERPFDRSRFVYAYDFAAEGLNRNEPDFETAPLVGRLDGHPYLALPTLFRGWTLRPEIGFEETYYTQQLLPGTSTTPPMAISSPINRNVLSASMEIRPPTVAKIFDRKLFGYVMKHTVEPFVIYHYQTGIDNYSQIIRFDQRDILADTNDVEYGIITRLYAKKTTSSADCFRHPKYASLLPAPAQPATNVTSASTTAQADTCDDQLGPARNVITWELAQKYYFDPTFGGALVPGSRNVFDSTVDLTGIAFLTEPRRFSPIISRVRIQDATSDISWALDYDPVLQQVNASTVFAGHRLGGTGGQWYIAAGQTYMQVLPPPNGPNSPPDLLNQWRAEVIYGGIGRRGFSAAANVSVDSELHYIQGAIIQTNYNWDCCGVAFEYERWALGLVRNENAYHFSLSLANIGTFGTIKKLQRLY